ncbi:MAG: O-antigen ligase family protein [Clostridiales bacterium]|nr:O-antigen ligase family protein [Clostridiales bacterium]
MTIINQLDKNKIKKGILIWILFVVIVAIPLAVRLRTNVLTGSVAMLYGGFYSHIDVFHKFKSELLLMIGFISFVLLLFNYKKFINVEKSLVAKLVFLYLLFIIASTVASQYFDIALFGIIERYEGFFAQLSYIVLFYLAYLIFDDNLTKWMYLFFLVSGVSMAIIGLMQYFEVDLFQMTWFQKMISSSDFQFGSSGFKQNFSSRTVVGMLYNPNYMGSYEALMIPMLLSGMYYFKSNFNKMIFAVGGILSVVVLILSHSSAGILGIISALVVFLILKFAKLDKRLIIGIFVTVLVTFVVFWPHISRFTGDIWRSFIFEENIMVEKVKILDDEIFVEMNDIGKDFSVKYNRETSELDFYDDLHQLKQVGVVSNTGEYYPLDSTYGFVTVNANIAGVTLNFYPLDLKMNEFGNKELVMPKLLYLRPVDKEIIEEKIVNHMDWIKVRKTNRRIINVKSDGQLKVYALGQNYQDEVILAESYFFEGYEHAGSGRGYIWSRSLPLLKDYLVIGAGPDVYAYVYPQNDILGKLNYMSNAYGIVDKPHNTYLQIAINHGVAGLFFYLAALAVFLFSVLKKNLHGNQIMNGIFYSIVAFSVTIFFNDSVVSIAPMFWLILGYGTLIIEDM